MTRTAADIAAMLEPHGLILRGGFALETALDGDLLSMRPTARQLVLVGNAGSAIWPALADFIKANPREQHPLDRWTQRVVSQLARDLTVTDLYPFGGPPWWPFQRWAQRAEPVAPSPIAILIHPVFGLWHAYRAALLLDEPVSLPPRLEAESPCATCIDRPCLSTCPVGAFDGRSYDVLRCAEHVDSEDGKPCRDFSCLARLACPAGTGWRYETAHALFHMNAFLRARREAKNTAKASETATRYASTYKG
ncbi:ferredoxin [Dongia soli]|uniref:Ferredoxin n=1 Tax=Dongia soli TaxID=600628 RepID=A0ABU5E9U7_9PROT|nr:ferredoxin [Dongia soli]MDY0882926.1 ferredoxin [Dongia soli]